MADIKPPRDRLGEAESVRMLLQYQRESFVRKLVGVDEAAARRSPVASDTTLLWLATHMADAELLWVSVRFAGLEADHTADDVATVAAALDRYRATWRRVDQILDAACDLDELTVNTGAESPVTLRWILLHLLEETARHAGHVDVPRELVDGTTGR